MAKYVPSRSHLVQCSHLVTCYQFVNNISDSQYNFTKKEFHVRLITYTRLLGPFLINTHLIRLKPSDMISLFQIIGKGCFLELYTPHVNIILC